MIKAEAMGQPPPTWGEPLRGARRVIAAVFLLAILGSAVVATIVWWPPSV